MLLSFQIQIWKAKSVFGLSLWMYTSRPEQKKYNVTIYIWKTTQRHPYCKFWRNLCMIGAHDFLYVTDGSNSQSHTDFKKINKNTTPYTALLGVCLVGRWLTEWGKITSFFLIIRKSRHKITTGGTQRSMFGSGFYFKHPFSCPSVCGSRE